MRGRGWIGWQKRGGNSNGQQWNGGNATARGRFYDERTNFYDAGGRGRTSFYDEQTSFYDEQFLRRAEQIRRCRVARDPSAGRPLRA